MKITLLERKITFRPWKPELGQVFKKTYAFDSETAKIDEERPWSTPPFVLGAACDGKQGFLLTRDHPSAFFEAHRQVPVAMHNAPFDLDVLHVLQPELDVYELVEANRVWDTQLLHRLYSLATAGHTAGGKGQSTLESCAKEYLDQFPFESGG